METNQIDRKKTQELISAIRFIAENIQPNVLLQHSEIINKIKEEVFDSLLGTMIPLVPRAGFVCWPDSGDETKFTYDYDKNPAHVSLAWKNYCDGRGIDYRDLVIAMSLPMLIDEEEKHYRELIARAKLIL